ncbi:hypothetical protein C8R42DRAFT_778070 [Lentinula raphanica]|nr:hypothetical protein C8R42DRAFT_778070 [Lentinula raphanica]
MNRDVRMIFGWKPPLLEDSAIYSTPNGDLAIQVAQQSVAVPRAEYLSEESSHRLPARPRPTFIPIPSWNLLLTVLTIPRERQKCLREARCSIRYNRLAQKYSSDLLEKRKHISGIGNQWINRIQLYRDDETTLRRGCYSGYRTHRMKFPMYFRVAAPSISSVIHRFGFCVEYTVQAQLSLPARLATAIAFQVGADYRSRMDFLTSQNEPSDRHTVGFELGYRSRTPSLCLSIFYLIMGLIISDADDSLK